MNLCSLNKKLLYILIKRNEEVIREKVQLPKKKEKTTTTTARLKFHANLHRIKKAKYVF